MDILLIIILLVIVCILFSCMTKLAAAPVNTTEGYEDYMYNEMPKEIYTNPYEFTSYQNIRNKSNDSYDIRGDYSIKPINVLFNASDLIPDNYLSNNVELSNNGIVDCPKQKYYLY